MPLRERLAFNLGGAGTVPSLSTINAVLAGAAEPTFATAAYTEPRDWGYAGLLAFTVVLLLRPQDQIPGLSSFHLAELFAALGIAPMVLHRLSHRHPVFRITPETVGLALFGAAIVATVPFSIWPGGAFDVFVDSYLKVFVVFVLMMNTLTTPRRIEQLVWIILLCCGFIAFRACFDYARGFNLVENGRLAGPVSGLFGNPNDLALNMVTFLPVAILIAVDRAHVTWRRITAAGIAAMMLATVVFTQSRSGAIGLVVMILALVLLGRRVRSGMGVMVFACVLTAVPLMPASFWARMSSIFDERADAGYTGSREARRVLLQEGWDAFVERPLTGVGAGQFKNYNPPDRKERWRETHNTLLQVASETGIVGLSAFLLLVASAAAAARQTRRLLASPARGSTHDPLSRVLRKEDRQLLYLHSVATSAGLIGWFICALFASVAYNWTFYYVLALIVAARETTRDRIRAGESFEAAALASIKGAGRIARATA